MPEVQAYILCGKITPRRRRQKLPKPTCRPAYLLQLYRATVYLPVHPLQLHSICWHPPCPPLGSPSRSESGGLMWVGTLPRAGQQRANHTVNVFVGYYTARPHSMTSYGIARRRTKLKKSKDEDRFAEGMAKRRTDAPYVLRTPYVFAVDRHRWGTASPFRILGSIIVEYYKYISHIV